MANKEVEKGKLISHALGIHTNSKGTCLPCLLPEVCLFWCTDKYYHQNGEYFVFCWSLKAIVITGHIRDIPILSLNNYCDFVLTRVYVHIRSKYMMLSIFTNIEVGPIYNIFEDFMFNNSKKKETFIIFFSK